MRRLARALAYLGGGIAVLLAAVMLYASTQHARDQLRDFALPRINRTLPGRLVVERIESLTPFSVRLRGVDILDPSSRRVARLDVLAVDYDPSALLLEHEVRLTRVFAREGFVRWDGREQPGPSITAAFVDPSAPPGNDEPYAGPSIMVRDIRLEELELRAVAPELGMLRVRSLGARADVAFDGALTLSLHEASGALWKDRAEIGRVQQLQGTLDTSGDQPTQVELDLALAGARLTGHAQAEPFAHEELEKVPVDVQLSITSLSPRVFDILAPAEAARRIPDIRRLDIELGGRVGRLRATVDANTAAGRVELSATLAELRDLQARAHLPSFRLAAIAPGSPFRQVQGTLQLNAHRQAETRYDITLATRNVQLDGTPLPDLDAAATLTSQELVVDSLRTRGTEGELRAQGRAGFDGSLRAELHARVPRLERLQGLRAAGLPPVRGALTADMSLQRTPRGRLRGRTDVKLRSVRVRELRVTRLGLKARAHGTAPHPAVDVRLEVRGVRAPGVTVHSLQADVQGDARAYRLRGRMTAEQANARLRAKVTPVGRRYRVDADVRGRVHLARSAERQTAPSDRGRTSAGRRFALGLDNVWIDPGTGRVRGVVRAHSGRARAELRGTHAPDGESDLQLDVRHLDLALLSTLAGQPAVAGRVDLTARLAGALAHPELDARVHYRDGYSLGGHELDAYATLQLRPRERRISLQARSSLGPLMRASMRVDGELSRSRRALVHQLKRARYDAVVDVETLSMAVFEPLDIEELRAAEGSLQGRLALSGTLQAAAAELKLDGRVARPRDPSPLDLGLRAEYRDGELSARTRIHDRWGKLLELDAEMRVGDDLLAQGPRGVDDILEATPWRAKARLHSRRLDELPVLSKQHQQAFPVRLDMNADIHRDPRKAPEGDAELNAAWDMPTAADAPRPGEHAAQFVPPCAHDARPELSLNVRLREARVDATVRGQLDGGDVLAGRAKVESPVDDERRSLGVEVKLGEVDLSRVPIVCAEMRGEVRGRASLQAGAGTEPSARLDLRTEGVSWAIGSPLDLVVQGRVARREARLALQAHEGGSRRGWAELRMPVRWQDTMLPQPALDEPLRADARLESMPLDLLGNALPGIGDVRGRTSGELHARGTLTDPELQGRLRLQKVSLTLEDLAQPLQDMTGTILVTNDEVQVRELVVRDREGKVEVDGTLQLDAEHLTGSASLTTDDFPLRRSGVILAEADARAELDFEATEQRTELRAVIHRLEAWLNEQLQREIQSLEPHPDIEFVDEEVSSEPEQGPARQAHIALRSAEPLWIHREDFSVQLTADIDIYAEPEGTRMTGQVELRRGFLSLIGKTFDLESGTVRFTGQYGPDPSVDVTAVHSASPSQEVRVTISGRVSQPELAFFANGERTTAGGALRALSGGRAVDEGGAEGSARQQAASVLTGMTVNLLSGRARRKFGGLMPVLAVEGGGTQGDTRIRAGIQADRIIPQFLRGIVHAAYVEGIVYTGREDTEARQTGTTAGVLVELHFPYHLVGTGEVARDVWSLDLTWEP